MTCLREEALIWLDVDNGWISFLSLRHQNLSDLPWNQPKAVEWTPAAGGQWQERFIGPPHESPHLTTDQYLTFLLWKRSLKRSMINDCWSKTLRVADIKPGLSGIKVLFWVWNCEMQVFSCCSVCLSDAWKGPFPHHYFGIRWKLSGWLPYHWTEFSLSGETLHFLSLFCNLFGQFGHRQHFETLSAVHTTLHQQQLVPQVWRAPISTDSHHDLVFYRLLVCCRGTPWSCQC